MDEPASEPRNVILLLPNQKRPPGTENDPYVLDFPALEIGQRDFYLGNFMGVWSGLEGLLGNILWALLGTTFEVAKTVTANGSGNAQLRELLLALGKLRLTESEQANFERLCRSLKELTTKRNRIVHGTWIPEVTVSENIAKGGLPEASYEWARVYQPTDPTLAKDMIDPKNQKARAAYRFTVPQIIDVTKRVNGLIQRLEPFSNAIHARLYPEGPPIG